MIRTTSSESLYRTVIKIAEVLNHSRKIKHNIIFKKAKNKIGAKDN